jgi:hypothetical protein
MTDESDRSAAAGDVVSELLDEAAGLRACAVIDADGEVSAASAPNDWAAQARRLWDAAADPSRPEPSYVHVAIDAGEVFAVRSDRFSVIGIADRFALSSLLLCDLRAALRQLDAVPT